MDIQVFIFPTKQNQKTIPELCPVKDVEKMILKAKADNPTVVCVEMKSVKKAVCIEREKDKKQQQTPQS